MAKKIIVLVVFVLGLAVCQLFARAGVRAVEQWTAITVSSAAWTPIPAAASVDPRRIGILIDIANGTTNQFLLVLSTSSVSPGVAITAGMTYKESDPPWELGIGKYVFLWAVNLGQGNETLYYQPLK